MPAYSLKSASIDDIRWAAALARRVYTGADVIPEERMLGWFEANPNGFFTIKTPDGQRAGNIDVLPVKPALLEEFVGGRISERQIGPDDLYAPAQHPQIRELYLESMVAVHKTGRPNAQAAAAALSKIGVIAANLCDPRQLERIYAIAASTAGLRLLQRFGFSIVQKAENRVDQHDLYAADFASIARLAG